MAEAGGALPAPGCMGADLSVALDTQYRSRDKTLPAQSAAGRGRPRFPFHLRPVPRYAARLCRAPRGQTTGLEPDPVLFTGRLPLGVRQLVLGASHVLRAPGRHAAQETLGALDPDMAAATHRPERHPWIGMGFLLCRRAVPGQVPGAWPRAQAGRCSSLRWEWQWGCLFFSP